MALSPIDGNSLNQLISTLQALSQSPDVGASSMGPAGPTDSFDPSAMGFGLTSNPGALGAPSGVLPSVDPSAMLSLYSSFGSDGIGSLSPSEFAMYQQLATEDPVAAQQFLLQMKLQKISELAQEVSNISKTRHDAITSIITNMKG